MKSIKKYAAGMAGLFFSGAMLVSCTKSFDEKVSQSTDFSGSTVVQVYVATVNASRNYVYIDSKPVNGASLISGSVFPATGLGFQVPGGLRSFLVRDTLTTTTQKPLSFANNMQAGKSYTIFTYDTITNPLQKTVETNIVVPDDTTARIRFAHFPYSPLPVPAVDIYSKNRGANIFTNVDLTSVTEFIPYESGVSDSLFVRVAGSGVNLQNWSPAPASKYVDVAIAITPTAKRSYTVVFRGGYRATTTNNATVRTLSTMVNR
ncbi:MAG: DUF4397 domain-containing protein [Sphingobacteriales bacterium]|nr:DUF4397 domain-containing protein [Sphingobacteriales bacterium]